MTKCNVNVTYTPVPLGGGMHLNCCFCTFEEQKKKISGSDVMFTPLSCRVS